jgi:hypothetical protein
MGLGKLTGQFATFVLRRPCLKVRGQACRALKQWWRTTASAGASLALGCVGARHDRVGQRVGPLGLPVGSPRCRKHLTRREKTVRNRFGEVRGPRKLLPPASLWLNDGIVHSAATWGANHALKLRQVSSAPPSCLLVFASGVLFSMNEEHLHRCSSRMRRRFAEELALTHNSGHS